MSCSDLWVGWMWMRLLMLKWQDKGTVTSPWCEQGCVVQLTMDDTFMLKSEWVHPYWLIDWKKLARCTNWEYNLLTNQNMDSQQFPSLAFKALFYWQLFLASTPLFICQPSSCSKSGLVWTLHWTLQTRIKDHLSPWVHLVSKYTVNLIVRVKRPESHFSFSE